MGIDFFVIIRDEDEQQDFPYDRTMLGYVRACAKSYDIEAAGHHASGDTDEVRQYIIEHEDGVNVIIDSHTETATNMLAEAVAMRRAVRQAQVDHRLSNYLTQSAR